MSKYGQLSDLEANAQQDNILLQVAEEGSYKITLRTIQDFNQAMMEEESPEVEDKGQSASG